MGPGKPGKFWNLIFIDIFESPGERLQVVENPGNLLNSSNKVFKIKAIRHVCRLYSIEN